MPEPEGRPPLAARDSSRTWFRGLCVVCWLAWMAVAALTVWALYRAGDGGLPLDREEVLSSFWATTGLCVAFPAAVYAVRWALERRGN